MRQPLHRRPPPPHQIAPDPPSPTGATQTPFSPTAPPGRPHAGPGAGLSGDCRRPLLERHPPRQPPPEAALAQASGRRRAACPAPARERERGRGRATGTSGPSGWLEWGGLQLRPFACRVPWKEGAAAAAPVAVHGAGSSSTLPVERGEVEGGAAVGPGRDFRVGGLGRHGKLQSS